MIGRVIMYVVLFAALILAIYMLYNLIADYSSTIKFFVMNETELDINQSSYDKTLQFYPNMRFASNIISYDIESSCDVLKKKRVLDSLNYLSNTTNLLSFYNSDNPSISITCQEVKKEPIATYFTVGEGGPTSIVNASNFYVIQKGEVLLFYKKTDCLINNYNIELHEILHVFGFEHSSNPNSIMYNVTSCKQIVTNDIINELERLYSIRELPDFAFDSASAIQQGRYLNFSLEVKNVGLKSGSVKLELYSDDKKFYDYDLGSIDYGEGKEVWGVTSLPSRQTSNIKFVLIAGDELNKANNVISLFLAT